MFSHKDFWHLAINMFVLWSFAPGMEGMLHGFSFFANNDGFYKINFALGLKNLMLTQNKFGNPFTVFMSYMGHEILLKR